MVAEMTSFGSSGCLEESGRDLPPPERKGSVTENESSSSSSENTEASTGGSSEDDGSDGEAAEDEEEEEEAAREGGAVGRDPDPVPEGSSGEQDGTGAVRICCERCRLSQNRSFELVTPRRISHGRLLVLLEAEGTYECSVTRLVFEVTQKAQVRYSVLSWSKFGAYLKDSWKFAGPIFDVDCDPSILTSIQFPHSLCLSDRDSEVSFSVLHVKSGRGLVEPSADHSGDHVKWRVTSLSPVGPIVQTKQHAEHHGVVLVFWEVSTRNSSSFHVYMAANNSSDIKDIQKQVRGAKKRLVKLEKPATCLLQEQRMYQLLTEPEGDTTPQGLVFTQAVLKMRSYFEVFFEQPPPFKLSLVEAESGQTVWSATLREGDFEDNAIERQKRKPAVHRKRSSSSSGEELTAHKRIRHGDVPDGAGVRKTLVTDEQLMKVARQMGKEWKQWAILYLGMTAQDVDETQDEEEPVMRKFRMLTKWRRRVEGEATAARLHACLNHSDVPTELRDLLEGMLPDTTNTTN